MPSRPVERKPAYAQAPYTIVQGKATSPNTGLVAEGLGYLTSAYAGKPIITAILTAALNSCADLNTVIWQVINQRLITSSTPPTGDLLTRVASIVGVQRNGLTDAQLLTLVFLQIRVNNSDGTAEDIIQVSNAMFPSSYIEFPNVPAAFEVQSWGLPLTGYPDVSTYAKLLGETKDAGARGYLRFSVGPLANKVIIPSRYGGVTSTNRMGSRYDVRPYSAFGSLASVREL